MLAQHIKENLHNPRVLEQLYRTDKLNFSSAFSSIYQEIATNPLADYWKIRLEFDAETGDRTKIDRKDILVLILSCLLGGILIKLPEILSIDLQAFSFYEKNAGLIVFLCLSLYHILTHKALDTKFLSFILGGFLIAAVYINLLPSMESHSITLAYLHLPILLWGLYAMLFIQFNFSDLDKRIEYLRHNGDLIILGGLILLAGMVLAGVSFGLFSAIDLNIERFYTEYVALWGLVSAPIVATFILRYFPTLTRKIAPVIATLFSPLVLLTLIIYLISIPLTGKNPYSDREFLLIFNMTLIGVLAIILFSVSENSIQKKQRLHGMVLLGLSLVSLVINLVTLSAIVYRLGEFGFTPNRLAVLGTNLLIFVNLFLIGFDLWKISVRNQPIQTVERTIARYLPVYLVWAVIVVFGFPLLFGFQ